MLDRLPENSDVIENMDSEIALDEKLSSSRSQLFVMAILAAAGIFGFWMIGQFVLAGLCALILAAIAYAELPIRQGIIADHDAGR